MLARLPTLRSNPDILRSTLDDHDAIKGEGGAWNEYLMLHADPGSQVCVCVCVCVCMRMCTCATMQCVAHNEAVPSLTHLHLHTIM